MYGLQAYERGDLCCFNDPVRCQNQSAPSPYAFMTVEHAFMQSAFGPGEGALITYLAKALPGRFPVIPQVAGNPSAAFAGDPSQFIELHGATDETRRLLSNKVKVCTSCRKPNAFTLDRCNQCGDDLTNLAIGSSNNVFTGFMFGIARGPFPFTVSIRFQDESLLVMDDLLSLSPLHFNVIPTREYIPDWRYLLRQPQKALALIGNMFAACVDASKPFVDNAEWRNKVVKGGALPPIGDIVLAGFNYPPSQYQLHIQFLLPILVPFQYAQYLKGVHFTPGRFFPYPYVVECLKAAVTHAVPEALLRDEASIESIVQYFQVSHKIDYTRIHGDFYSRARTLQQTYSNWDATDFGGSVVEYGGRLRFVAHDGSATVEDIAAVAAADKAVLQNYGRPYTQDGKPTGSYYGFPKKPSEVSVW